MQRRIRLDLLLVGMLLACGPLTEAEGEPESSEGTTYYASGAGGGNGRREASPFRITDFWAKAKPGDILLLLDGTYRGASSMIAPPRGLSGDANRPITVRALHDGGVDIDGENARRPVKLYENNWFILATLCSGRRKVCACSTDIGMVCSPASPFGPDP